MTAVLKKGVKAYLDSPSSGLVPCKVLSVKSYVSDAITYTRVTVRFTATRDAWACGSEWIGTASSVVPRAAIRRRDGKPIINAYRIEVDK